MLMHPVTHTYQATPDILSPVCVLQQSPKSHALNNSFRRPRPSFFGGGWKIYPGYANKSCPDCKESSERMIYVFLPVLACWLTGYLPCQSPLLCWRHHRLNCPGVCSSVRETDMEQVWQLFWGKLERLFEGNNGLRKTLVAAPQKGV